jgi:benzoyl-CoA reductase/2-hydroxyglutaryl-CoA dehydratase subunit BcrC/BadD/HgdB
MEILSVMLTEAQHWGPSAITGVMALVVLQLIKHLKENGEKDDEHFKALQGQLNGAIKALEERLVNKIEDFRKEVAKWIDDHEKRIKTIELDYLKKEDFYRENAGWRAEILALNAKIDGIVKEIIELWK